MNKVLLIQPTIQPAGVEVLESGAEIVMAPDGSEETLISFLSRGDIAAVVTRVEKLTRRVIQAARGLRVIGQHGVGVDNIDVEAATEHGIIVVHAPTSNFMSTAEHAVMLMLALSRRLLEADAAVRTDDFQFRERFFPVEVNGKVLLVVGLGRIGCEVARKCRIALNMEVLGYDPYVSEDEMAAMGIRKVDLETGLRSAHFVSVHVALTRETRHLIDDRALSLMRPGSFLVNASRGAVVKQDALVRALREKRIAGAGLDVFEQEPPEAGDPLLELSNVILTPHFAGDTYEAKQRCSRSVAHDVLAVLDDRMPRFVVNPEVFIRQWA